MKEIFDELITRYEAQRGDFVEETLPKQSWWREILKLSSTPKAEEHIEKELDFYRAFEAELDAIPKIRKKTVELSQWDEIVHFLKVHNERLSSQIDNSTTITTTFVFLGSILLLMATKIGPGNYIAFVVIAIVTLQIFMQRIRKRHELSRNKEILIIIENYIKKRRATNAN